MWCRAAPVPELVEARGSPYSARPSLFRKAGAPMSQAIDTRERIEVRGQLSPLAVQGLCERRVRRENEVSATDRGAERGDKRFRGEK